MSCQQAAVRVDSVAACISLGTNLCEFHDELLLQRGVSPRKLLHNYGRELKLPGVWPPIQDGASVCHGATLTDAEAAVGLGDDQHADVAAHRAGALVRLRLAHHHTKGDAPVTGEEAQLWPLLQEESAQKPAHTSE